MIEVRQSGAWKRRFIVKDPVKIVFWRSVAKNSGKCMYVFTKIMDR